MLLVQLVDGRKHWRIEGRFAVYQPPGATKHVRVTRVQDARAREQWRAALMVGDRAERNVPAGTALEAVRWAERASLT